MNETHYFTIAYYNVSFTPLLHVDIVTEPPCRVNCLSGYKGGGYTFVASTCTDINACEGSRKENKRLVLFPFNALLMTRTRIVHIRGEFNM